MLATEGGPDRRSILALPLAVALILAPRDFACGGDHAVGKKLKPSRRRLY